MNEKQSGKETPNANSVFIDFFYKTFDEQRVKSLRLAFDVLTDRDPDNSVWIRAFFDNLDRIRVRNVLLQKEYRYINYLEAMLDFFAAKFAEYQLTVPAVLSELQEQLSQMRPKIVALVGEPALNTVVDKSRALSIPKELEQHLLVLKSEIKNASLFTNTSLKSDKVKYLQAVTACYQLQGGYTPNDLGDIASKARPADPDGFIHAVEQGRTGAAIMSMSGPFADGMRDGDVPDEESALKMNR